MKNWLKISLCCIPLLVAGGFAVYLPKIREKEAAENLKQLESLPLKTRITISGDEIYSTRHTYSLGDYGVTEIGRLRLVFIDLPFSGNSSSGVTLATEENMSGGGGHTGVGNRRFEVEGIPNGSECSFGGATFEFIDGKLNFDERVIDAVGKPSMVLIGEDRKILEVKPLAAP
ncbi:MAG: hypothetical protein AB8D78_14360 [Akkermansiaceae bacterium]